MNLNILTNKQPLTLHWQYVEATNIFSASVLADE
jgi:hypothetical protein